MFFRQVELSSSPQYFFVLYSLVFKREREREREREKALCLRRESRKEEEEEDKEEEEDRELGRFENDKAFVVFFFCGNKAALDDDVNDDSARMTYYS